MCCQLKAHKNAVSDTKTACFPAKITGLAAGAPTIPLPVLCSKNEKTAAGAAVLIIFSVFYRYRSPIRSYTGINVSRK